VSKKPCKHKITIRKKGKLWWTKCSCGMYQGWFDKNEAQKWMIRHIDQIAEEY